MTRGELTLPTTVAICALLVVSSSPAQNVTVFAEGLQRPLRATFTPQGNLLVSEGGLPAPNTGRLSLLDRSGARRSIIEGLPSGPAHFTLPYGPTSTAIDGNIVYLLIGEGVYSGSPPNVVINPQGPASPIFSSILKIVFSAEIDRLRGTFRLGSADQWALLDGYDVELSNDAGERARVLLLTALRPLVRNVLGGPSPTRQSDPYGLVLDSENATLYFSDPGMETVSRVDTTIGRPQVMVRFLPFVREDGVSVDNVPTGLCRIEDRLYVGFLSGAPFPAGEASVNSVDLRSGASEQAIRGLTAVTDVLCGKSASGENQIITLESNPLAPNSTRVQIHQSGTSRVIAEGLPQAGGAARDPIGGDLFVMVFPSTILRVTMP
jgi:hypothetical protein